MLEWGKKKKKVPKISTVAHESHLPPSIYSLSSSKVRWQVAMDDSVMLIARGSFSFQNFEREKEMKMRQDGRILLKESSQLSITVCL